VLPLRIFCEYIAKETGAKIALLLIEPENTEFGEGLTPQISSSAKNIVRILLEILPKRMAI
jgi:Ni,Fe-hydrogenase maturation factor